MYDLNQKSLAAIKQDPLYQKMESTMAEIKVADYAANLNQFKKISPTCPVQEITKFYLIDQCFFILEKQYGVDKNLPPDMYEIAQMMKKELTLTGNKIFHFLIKACLLEIGRFNVAGQNASFFTYLATGYGDEFANELMKKQILNGKNHWAAVNIDLKNIQSMSLEKMIAAMVAVFCSGKWSFGAGGSGWGNIAKCANNFLRGSMSLHEMSDYAFSLCHDRGSFFDRCMWGAQDTQIFAMKLNLTDIFKILDVQASGQIPQFVNLHKNFLNNKAKKIFEIFSTIEPSVFRAPLNHSLIKDSTKKREAALQAQWKASQAHHNQIAGLTAQKAQEAKLPPVEKIDKILVNDFKSQGLISQG